MGGEQATIAVNSNPARTAHNSRSFRMLAPLIDGADSTVLREAIASGAKPESLRKELFRMFSTMQVADPEKKKALISELIGCTPCENERQDLARILKMETAPAEHRMLVFAYKGSTQVLFEYALRKLISMERLPGMSSSEKEYFDDVLSSVVHMASKDKIHCGASRRVFERIMNNGASPEVKELVGNALKELNGYIFTDKPIKKYSFQQ
ncbi:Uncharacterised protein [uncultured archaeon]|nr:Uncharacterised protein [uncultured archaeon]